MLSTTVLLWTGITWASLKISGHVPFHNELLKMILSGLRRLPDTRSRSFVERLFGPALLPFYNSGIYIAEGFVFRYWLHVKRADIRIGQVFLKVESRIWNSVG